MGQPHEQGLVRWGHFKQKLEATDHSDHWVCCWVHERISLLQSDQKITETTGNNKTPVTDHWNSIHHSSRKGHQTQCISHLMFKTNSQADQLPIVSIENSILAQFWVTRSTQKAKLGHSKQLTCGGTQGVIWNHSGHLARKCKGVVIEIINMRSAEVHQRQNVDDWLKKGLGIMAVCHCYWKQLKNDQEMVDWHSVKGHMQLPMDQPAKKQQLTRKVGILG